MTLHEICTEIAIVEEKLAYGEIEFTYPKICSAMKLGHPADILDDILSIIGWDVNEGKEPKLKSLKKVLTELKEFQEAFNVDLSDPIKHLEEYIAKK
jgi:hypothetical protein